MNVKKNLSTLLPLLLFLSLLIFAMILLWVQMLNYRTAKNNLKSAQENLERLHDLPIFPSEENVKKVQKNYDRLSFEVNELESELKRDPYPLEAKEAAEFSAKAQRSLERLNLRAKATEISLADELEAGFDQYVRGGAIPKPKEVARLSRQLYAIDKVADLFISAGVDSIESISREPFENMIPEQKKLSARERRKQKRNKNLQKEESQRMLASELPAHGLYSVERISAAVTVREDQLWNVLNKFVSAPHFMVLANFSTQTKSDILNFDIQRIKEAENGDDETLKYLANGILTGENALPRPDRLIAGDELIELSVTVAVYHFEPIINEELPSL